jgi:hypothetical protein
MSWGPGNLIVRANYLATVVFATCLALIPVASGLWDAFRGLISDWPPIAMILLVTVLYLLPGVRALRRLFIHGTVIPPELVHERPVVAWVVSLAGGFGHFFFVIVAWAVIDMAARPEWPDGVGGPMAFFFGIAMLSYLISLLCAELALVGDGVSDAARAARSGPVT